MPIKWRVLDADKANDSSTDGMFLLSEYLLASGVQFEAAWDSDDGDGQTNPNEWQHSDAQNWCKTFASNTSNFSAAEQSAMLGITKTDSAENSLYSLNWGESSLTADDKMFFLSVRELADYVGSYDGAPGLTATTVDGSAGEWWLRSPSAGDARNAGAVGYSYSGRVYYSNVLDGSAVRPAFNLDLTSVLFTSAAAGGKIPAAGSGGNQGGEAADAIFEIGDYDGSEWKLTLLDKERKFNISNATTNGNGDTIAFSYSGAQTGENEYISAVIADNGETTYYGRILQLDGATGGASGTASFTLPAGVTLSDTTKLYVFNEQYNGGENDDTKLTDYASQLIEIANPAVDTTAPTLTPGSATRDSETAATVKFTSDEAGEYYYAVVESGDTAPTIDTTVAGTSCDTTEQTISLTSLSGAGAKDIYIVAKDAAGNVSQQLKITIPAYIAPSYGISASPAALDFGSKTVGYTEAPAAQTVTLTNTGNQNVTVTLPASANYTITAGEGFAGGAATLAPNGTAAFTVQPNTGLTAGTYDETLTVSGGNNVSASVELSFEVLETYTLTVDLNGGSGSTTGGEYTAGEVVSINAGSKAGYRFAGWTASGGGTFADPSSASTTFTMPAADTTITASWTAVPSGPSTYQVTIDSDITGGIVTASPRWAARGDTVYLTVTPDEGYELSTLSVSDRNGDALDLDNEGSGVYSFTMPIGRVTVTATFDKAVITLPFTDVSDSDWFYEPVCFVYSQGLMTGTSATTFEPNTPLSRAMLVAILHRLEGSPAVSSGTFTDVANGDWYAEAVNWAASVGVVNGFDDGSFQPNTAITREQMAAILMNYAQYKGQDVSARATLDTYSDATAISSWANDVMSWAVAEGLLTGVTNDQLQPQGNATRAQVAAILQRFLAQ